MNVHIKTDFKEMEPLLNTNNFDKSMDSDIMHTLTQSETINMKDKKSPQECDIVDEKTLVSGLTKFYFPSFGSHSPNEAFKNNSALTKRRISELRHLAFGLKVDTYVYH